MADKASTKEKDLSAVLAEFQKLTDYEKRKAFYESNPELKAIIDPGNFSS